MKNLFLAALILLLSAGMCFAGGPVLTESSGGTSSENEIEAFIFDADAQTITANWEIQDGVHFSFGNDDDASWAWDAADVRLELRNSSDTPIFWFDLANSAIGVAAVTAPESGLYDSDAAGADRADEYAGGVSANMTTTTEDAEVSDVVLNYMNAGTKTEGLKIDGSDGKVNIGALNFVTTGSSLGRPTIYSVSSNTTLSAEQMSGGIILVTAACEISLGDFCDSATGAMAMIVQADASETIEIGVTDTSDDMILDGTALGANQEIDSPGDAVQDNFLVIMCRETNEWHTYGRSGPWVDGGAAD